MRNDARPIGEEFRDIAQHEDDRTDRTIRPNGTGDATRVKGMRPGSEREERGRADESGSHREAAADERIPDSSER